MNNGGSPADPHDHLSTPNPWPADFLGPYGYGSCARHMRLGFSRNRDQHRLGRASSKALTRLLGFEPIHALRNLQRFREADVVWTHTEHEYLAVALLIRLGLLRGTKLIGQSVWLWDDWDRLPFFKRALFRWLLGVVDLHTTLSSANAEKAAQVVHGPVVMVPYGADPTDPAPPFETGRWHVIAPGSDRHRDWATLAEAMTQVPEARLTVLSRRLRAQRAFRRSGPSISVTSARDRADMHAWYGRCDAVAVPLRNNLHASGLTTVIEALLSMRPVVATEVGGLGEYFPLGVDWVPVGDSAGWSRAMRRLIGSPPGQEQLEAARGSIFDRGLTSVDYGLRHVILAEYVLGRRPDARAASAFRRIELG